MQGTTSFRCPACGSEFATQEKLHEHGRQEHAGGSADVSSFRCPACGAEFTTQAQLEEHGKQAHPQQ